VLFWSTDIISYLLVIANNATLNNYAVYGILSRIPLVAAVVYFILYYLIPRYSGQKKGGYLFLWILFILAFVGIGIRYYRFYVMDFLLDPAIPIPDHIWTLGGMVQEIFSWMSIISLAIAIKLIKARGVLQRRNEELADERRKAELAFLKAQMHPHFLFNTLNTLYADVLASGSRSEQIVLRLSGLLRFILEECTQAFIPLERELKVIDDYVALEKLRHQDRLDVQLQTDIADPGVRVSPLLMLPFVENSFKHTLAHISGVVHIHIQVKADEKWVRLWVENDSIAGGEVPVVPGMGIGNVRRQLELVYGQSFTLDISRGKKFSVYLQIPVVAI